MLILGLVSEGILGLLSAPPCLMGLSHEPGGGPLVPYLMPFFRATHVMGGGLAFAGFSRLPSRFTVFPLTAFTLPSHARPWV